MKFLQTQCINTEGSILILYALLPIRRSVLQRMSQTKFIVTWGPFRNILLGAGFVGQSMYLHLVQSTMT